ncbi:hypothetical protein, partial [Pseudomonas viridiflava]|uniref:hypothetical protein n=1 Tax=Pseudomonas viridiflava TaxID=33069 RepID=UPI00198216BE
DIPVCLDRCLNDHQEILLISFLTFDGYRLEDNVLIWLVDLGQTPQCTEEPLTDKRGTRVSSQ